MLSIIHSNRLEQLAVRLADGVLAGYQIAESARADSVSILQAETVLVPSQGTAQWLKQFLAERWGVVAQISFVLPASFIWQVCQRALPNVAIESEYELDRLTWRLYGLLPKLLALPHFAESAAPLQQYLQDDLTGFKRWQLSREIALVFDQYQVYRRDWIESIEAGREEAVFTGLPWQPLLWRALVEDIGHGHHRARLTSALLQSLSQVRSSAVVESLGLPSRLFVFATLALPEDTWQLLAAMAKHIDVFLLLPNPCAEYWSDLVSARRHASLALRQHEAKKQRSGRTKANQDQLSLALEDAQSEAMAEQHIDVGHPLLSGLGQLNRDSLEFGMRLANEIAEGQEADGGAQVDDDFIEPGEESLLTRLQTDLLHLRYPTDASLGEDRWISTEDRSIEIHITHSRLREVEVLHDQLLHRFESLGGLKPKDIVVMVPNLATYTPLIEAVFGTAPRERFIPYSIADRQSAEESPLLAAVWNLFDLLTSRWPQSAVLELLSVPEISQRFGLNPDQLQNLLRAVRAANVHWGQDPSQWRVFTNTNDGTQAHSWRAGLDRLMLSYAAGAGYRYGDVRAPSEFNIETENLEVLLRFYGALSNAAAAIEAPKELAAWSVLLGGLLTDFFELNEFTTEFDQIAFATLRSEVARLAHGYRRSASQSTSRSVSQAGDETVAAAVVMAHLRQRVNGRQQIGGFFAGKVTFCTLLPMRSLPFPVVALLGMNDADYPRISRPSGFDLMHKSPPRRGDRRRGLEDRQLFLEAILSARRSLYISYVGRGDQDDVPRPPSVLLSALLDVLVRSYRGANGQNIATQLITQHRLQPFHSSYFQEPSNLVGYDDRWLPGAKENIVRGLAAPPPIELPQVVKLTDLESFVRAPQRWHVREILGGRFVDDRDEPADDEPFELSGLAQWSIKGEGFARLVGVDGLPQKAAFESYAEDLRVSGELPYGYAGDQAMANTQMTVQCLHERVAEFQPHLWQRHPINLQLEGVYLQGEIEGCHDKNHHRVRIGNSKPRDRVVQWLRHLVLNAEFEHRTFLFDDEKTLHLSPIDRSVALMRLNAIVRSYLAAHRAPPHLLVDTAVAWVESGEDKAKAAWYPDESDTRSREQKESQIPEVKALFPDGKLPERFAAEASACYTDMRWQKW